MVDTRSIAQISIPPFLLALLLGGCSGLKDISEEPPYDVMMGKCYILQQDLVIRRNICQEHGKNLSLTSDGGVGLCYKEVVRSVNEGAKINIQAIHRYYSFGMGTCPQIVVAIEGIDSPGGDIYLPLCFQYLKNEANWLKNTVWSEGEEIHLREEFVKPCE